MTSFTAWTPPNDTRMFRISTSGGAGDLADEVDGCGVAMLTSSPLTPGASEARSRTRPRRRARRPATMSWVEFSTPIRVMPVDSDCMTTAPSTPPAMVPMPPAKEVPPMTAAAITCSSAPVPRAEVAAFRRAVMMTAAIAASTPITMNVFMIVHRVLMPASTAASGLPPMEYTYRPNRRRAAMKAMRTAMPIAMSTGIAIPVGMMRPPGGIGDPVLDGVGLRQRRGPWVAVEDRHRRRHQDAARGHRSPHPPRPAAAESHIGAGDVGWPRDRSRWR